MTRSRLKTANLVTHKVLWVLHLPFVSLTVLLSCLYFFPSVAASEIYKCKDSNGNVIFSDSPQAGSNAEEVRLKKDSRFERPSSWEDNVPKTGIAKKAATEKRMRDARDITAVMYMTDW